PSDRTLLARVQLQVRVPELFHGSRGLELYLDPDVGVVGGLGAHGDPEALRVLLRYVLDQYVGRAAPRQPTEQEEQGQSGDRRATAVRECHERLSFPTADAEQYGSDRKSTRLNSSHEW